MGHIFVFPVLKNNSCICDLETEIIDTEYKAMHHKELDITSIPHEITTCVNQVMDAYSSPNKNDVTSSFGEMLLNAAKSNNALQITSAYVLIDVCSKIKNQHCSDARRFNRRYGEDTFIHHFLAPWIDNVFHGEHYHTKWVNAQLEAYISSSSEVTFPSPTVATPSSKKLYPDFKLQVNIKSFKFDLLVVEIKPPGSSIALYDQRKLAYELKTMIDHLVHAGIPSPVVCGLWVDGTTCISYKMDLRYNGIYRFIELDTFNIPVTMEDVLKIRVIISALNKLKTTNDETATMIEDHIKMKRNTSGSSSSSSHIKYTRTGQCSSVRTKKQKI